MLRRLLSSILVITLLVTVFVAASPFSVNKANAEEYRGGYTLIPVLSDSTGVNTESKFLLKAQTDISITDITMLTSIDGEPVPEITKTASKTFFITPSRELEQNKLYTFRIKQNVGEDITWTFQTSSTFKIASVLPGDQTTGVPTNSGIEIYFSNENYENINSHFVISPAVKGTFERHKTAAVFVPDGLKEGTLYTVTIKKGLKLTGTKYSLAEDYVFKFETGTTTSSPDTYYKGQFSYNDNLNEFTPREKPNLPINYYINNQVSKSSSVKVQTTVYGYGNIDTFLGAVDKKESVPSWAYLSYLKNNISISKLSKVATFSQDFAISPTTQQFIKIPQKLPTGYYLIDSKWEDIRFQTFIQVTDIGMYIMKSDTKTLIWLNDLASKAPIEGASINLVGNKTIYKSDSSGISSFLTPSNVNVSVNNYDTQYFKIVTKGNKTALLSYSQSNYYYYNGLSSNQYWNYIYLDRNIYKPDDTIQFWGFLKNRYINEDLQSLTVEFGQGYNYYYPMMRIKSSPGFHYSPTSAQPMIKQSLSIENGKFSGEIKLPSPDPGGYQLTVKNGDKIVATTYVTIQNYVKPTYKLEAAKNKEAIFPGQKVEFTFKAAFFEGTGLPGLDLNISGAVSDSKKTDKNGEVKVSYIPDPGKNEQGETYANVNCNATLPEIGATYQNSSVRVFVNDINVALTTDINKDTKTINATVNKIVLDRLNDGTAKDSMDYLGDPVNNKTLKGTIIKNTWVKTLVGQYYDFINKVTQNSYRYDLKTENVKDFTMTTGSDGKASFEANLLDLKDGYYSAQLSCEDDSNRTMSFMAYLATYYDTSFYSSYDDNRYYLDGGKESYKMGDEVSLTFNKGKTALPKGKYLFVKSQNGIRNFSTTSTSAYSFKLAEKDIPSTYVTGVYFNGKTYVESEIFNAVFDYSQKNLVINATADKTSYKPGETAIIKITAKDKTGKLKKAFVNASIVDEALFSLSDQTADTLATLYSGVSSGISYTYSSHLNSGPDDIDEIGGVTKEMKNVGSNAPQSASDSSYAATLRAPSSNPRSDFKDTAHFETITLDENGSGEIKFKLPDNITSWRITLTGVSNDLYGGNSSCSLVVSLPLFINYTMNSTYLTGDKPVLGVTAYGNDLKGDDIVTYVAASASNPDNTATATGKAFERVNIPLWKLEEGKDDIIINAYTKSGLSDSLKHKISVVDSYHQIDTAIYYTLTPGLNFEGGKIGNTSLVFTDKSRGSFLPEITNLMYSGGNRIDQQLSAYSAAGLIQKYFNVDGTEYSDKSFNAIDYQTQDGGIAILPYGSSDADLSAKVSSLIKDSVNTQKLKDYFYSILTGDNPGVKGNALYGLTVLREPVLLDLNKAATVKNASVKDLIFIALAYCELGETASAQKLYNDRISKYVEVFKPYYRVDTGIDNDDILECTSLASILASKLDLPQKQGFYGYCTAYPTVDILVNIEKVLYIEQEIEKVPAETVKFSYTYDGEKYTKTLVNGESYTLVVPSSRLSLFKIDSVEGNASMVSFFKQKTVSIDKLDSNISVSRKYFVGESRKDATTSFKQGDIVLVEITSNIGSKALDGSYEITDYLPSGLVPIENSYSYGVNYQKDSYYSKIDGQKVTFYGYKDTKNNPQTYSYYARIVSPGTYKADGTIIQNVQSKDSINVGNEDTITIE